jgi:hypothetical protein
MAQQLSLQTYDQLYTSGRCFTRMDMIHEFMEHHRMINIVYASIVYDRWAHLKGHNRFTVPFPAKPKGFWASIKRLLA